MCAPKQTVTVPSCALAQQTTRSCGSTTWHHQHHTSALSLVAVVTSIWPTLHLSSRLLTGAYAYRSPRRRAWTHRKSAAARGRTWAPRTRTRAERTRWRHRRTHRPPLSPSLETGSPRSCPHGTGQRIVKRYQLGRILQRGINTGVLTDICIGHNISMSSGPPWLWSILCCLLW